MLVILVIGSLRQEDRHEFEVIQGYGEFQASLDYSVRHKTL